MISFEPLSIFLDLNGDLMLEKYDNWENNHAYTIENTI